jgi:hypothetical protein
MRRACCVDHSLCFLWHDAWHPGAATCVARVLAAAAVINALSGPLVGTQPAFSHCIQPLANTTRMPAERL